MLTSGNAVSADRKLGFWSATALIVGRIIGVGIFSTPGSIVASVGSIGAAICCWIIGALAAFCGLSVWLEWATRFPQSGGDKIYLAQSYPRPKLLTAYTFASRTILLGATAGGSIVFSSNVQASLGIQAASWLDRSISVAALTAVCLIHGLLPTWGLRLINIITAFKVIVLGLVVLIGMAVLTGCTRIQNPRENLDTDRLWEGTQFSGALWTSALFKTFNSYSGWANASFVLSEIKDPQRNVVRSGIFGLTLCACLYSLVNLAYFAAIPKEELSHTIAVAGLFAKKVFGAWAERIVCACVALSALGNVLANTFVASRMIREIAKDHILPDVVLSDWPNGGPLAAFVVHWIPAVLTIILPPPGLTAYSFVLDVEGYTLQLFYLAVTIGLFRMRRLGWRELQSSPEHFTCWTPLAAAFATLCIGTVVVPWLPPAHTVTSIPYWTAPMSGLGVIGLGIGWWWIRVRQVDSVQRAQYLLLHQED